MKALDIKVERTGFPIILAGHEFFFDCSLEHLTEYEEAYDKVMQELKELEDQAEEKDNELYVTILTKGYDSILGAGSFGVLYKEVPDIIAWLNAFYDLSLGISESIEEFTNKQGKMLEERSKKSEELKQQYLKKVSQKRG
jgi:hypothetical protein